MKHVSTTPQQPEPHASTTGHGAHGSLPALALAAIGIVFGDIGTSPLYSMQTVFSIEHNEVKPTPTDVLGVISFAFWSIAVIVSFKYVALVMRADNDGEGGILALTALLKGRFTKSRRATSTVILLGVVGAALFYGDSIITPAISVMSAVEGLEVVRPGLGDLVMPISVVILTMLFFAQRWGTAVVGKAFGPIMIAWFATLALLGIPHIVEHPDILRAFSPHYAATFAAESPYIAFVAMGAIVLTITGAEALYADMGHFGPVPIQLAWFWLVFPALILNYMGQGAMILHDPATSSNPFFQMAPAWATLPLVVLATMATVIASQAVISGAFSVSRQAMRLGLLPRLVVRQTSKEEGGQIYVPAINWLLFVGVLVLIGVFQSSAKLATAYGLAVTGTLLLTLTLFLLLAHYVWKWPTWWLVVIAVVVGGAELTFFAANLTKIVTGGWLPLIIAGTLVALMTSWRQGAALVSARRRDEEGSLAEFMARLQEKQIPRVPGLAVYPHPDAETVPIALRTMVRSSRTMHENVVICTLENTNVPHIRHVDRVTIDDLGDPDDGIAHVRIRIGFNDNTSIPAALALVAGPQGVVTIDPDTAWYFVSQVQVAGAAHSTLPRWRRMLFFFLRRNAADAVDTFKLPPERTVTMGARIQV